MAKIKLNFKGLSVPEKIARAQQIVSALTDNTDFPSPQPTLAQVTSSINALDEASSKAQQARQESKARTSEQNDREDDLDRTMTQLVGYLESVAGGDETKIKQAGLDVKDTNTTADEINVPANFNISASDHDGELDLQWDTVRNARSYIVERSADPPGATTWTQAAIVTRSRATIMGLTSGTKYWFRVAALGPAGQSGWSNPATKIAP